MSVFTELNELFQRTKADIQSFMNIITPRIENAENEHDRLYWHHILEEEEQHLDRLVDLLPKLQLFLENDELQSTSNPQFVYMLQDVSLEKFGLHNFEEHLDLALFQFKEGETSERLEEMRQRTEADYNSIKVLLQQLNDQFNNLANRGGSTPTDDKEDVPEELKRPDSNNSAPSFEAKTNKNPTRRLTVGSLK